MPAEKKMAFLAKLIFFETGDILHCTLENEADLGVNERLVVERMSS